MSVHVSSGEDEMRQGYRRSARSRTPIPLSCQICDVPTRPTCRAESSPLNPIQVGDCILISARPPTLVPVPVEDPAAGEVVGAELDQHPVKRQDLDVVLPYLPADVRQYLVPVLELHGEGGVAQTLDDGALEFDAA